MVLSIVVTSVTILICVVLMAFQIYRNWREKALVSFSTRHLPICLLMITLQSMVAIVFGDRPLQLIPINLIVGLFPLWLLSSSFLPKSKRTLKFCWISEILVCCVYITTMVFRSKPVPSIFYVAAYVSLSIGYILYFITSFWIYIRTIRNLVRKTTVWTMLTMSVDVIYVFFIISDVLILCAAFFCKGILFQSIFCVAVFFMLVMLIVITARISSDSLFCVMKCHENLILESINDHPTEVTASSSAPDDSHKEIFDRIVTYFETEAPYLSGNLVIEDLVKAVYANKLYVSRAISRCTGRNFCQFVNYYRVKHSLEVFRNNPELKVAELAGQSGFNSVVSFTMAFKLYMNENPSDWIRQERNRLSKSRSLTPI